MDRLDGYINNDFSDDDIGTRLYLSVLKSIDSKDVVSEIREMTWNATISDQHAPEIPLLSEDDLCRFGAPPRYLLSSSSVRALQNEIHDILTNMVAIVLPEGLEADKRLEKTSTLRQEILRIQIGIREAEKSIASSFTKLSALLQETNEAHHDFQNDLEHALRLVPPILQKSRSATDDLTSATIETSLIKLSMIRAKTQRALYDHRSTKHTENPNNMAQAVTNAFKKFKETEKELQQEDHALGQELNDYEVLLKIIDGGSGGFRQVIEDWSQVKRETEECRKDLRRLGWTGD